MDCNQSQLISPFGPKILVSQCPKKIVDSLNDYTEKVCGDKNLQNKYSSFGSGNIPNLLERNLENIFIDKKFCQDSGVVNYLENISNLYLQKLGQCFINEHNSASKEKIALAKNFANKKVFSKLATTETGLFSCWINRYFNNDYTPLHVHSFNLSGVLFLKLPKFLSKNNLTNNNTQGKLCFIFGKEEKIFCNEMWYPEQKVGTILIFPSWARHIAYPTCSDEERRTLSFNLELCYFNEKQKSIVNYF